MIKRGKIDFDAAVSGLTSSGIIEKRVVLYVESKIDAVFADVSVNVHLFAVRRIFGS